ncbi:AAA-like domain-containing protein [Kamptonema cortianum]|uniref:AAA-like domain-containing protein n=1 Tax=Geitlerinema calcuttense NRMC-F 0142 TaxID=2922238 RepID=A0ABT7LWG4_9CYAN|nr:AAA-like domain-containing protein [Geitlerinema calcuttense]MDK3157234.1 AAA-like domain-containing protein [Kamptonema cortianum]MDL5056366.1 AAA-like domain-containing protein [Geitlerinema calcuttense NRMC-F 0142]
MTAKLNAPYHYQLGGSLPLGAPTYIERQADAELEEALIAGDYCYILDAPQTGKSSLRIRTMDKLQAQGIVCVELDLSGIGSQQITEEQWYGGIVQTLASGLGVPFDRRNGWHSRSDLSPVQRLQAWIETVLLSQIPQNIVLFIDPVDSVLGLNFSTDAFFALIRQCYDRRAADGAYQRLTFALLGTATPRELIGNRPKANPFAVSRALTLDGLQPDGMASLAGAQVENPQALALAIWHWTRGQPFLTQKLYSLVHRHLGAGILRKGEETHLLEHMVQTQIIEAWEAQDRPVHFRAIRDRLFSPTRSTQQLLKLYQGILQQGRAIADNPPECLELQTLGLIARHQDRWEVHNPIYAAIFNLDWVNQALKLKNSPLEMISVSAALIFTDIVASTARMVADEQHTLHLVQRDLQQMRQLCQQFGGQVLKSLGDGLLMSFESPEKAVSYAIAIQEAFAIASSNLPERDILYHRIGIHLGDVFFRGDDVMGKGVNLASRLQQQAEPGGICLSQSVYDQVQHLLKVEVIKLGLRKLKGIPEPVPLYQIPPYRSSAAQEIKPARSPYYPSGAVPLDSPFYLERTPVEAQVYDEMKKPGALVRIKAPKEMGKTSLMLRALDHTNTQGFHTVTLSLEQIDSAILNDLNRFLRWLCANVTRQLQLEPKLDDYWDEDIGSKISCTLYFHCYLLEKIQMPLVLALDEVNYVFEHPHVAKEVLPLFRSWYEEAKRHPIWQKLRLIIVHSTEIYVPLQLKQSPFNVGLPIELGRFTLEQVRTLAQRYGLRWTDDQQAQPLMSLVGGHPALIHLALYHLSRGDTTIEQLQETAFTTKGIYIHHLQRHQVTLQEQPELSQAFYTVLNSTEPVPLESIVMYKLSSMGLIKSLGNTAIVSCELYRQYFMLQRKR